MGIRHFSIALAFLLAPGAALASIATPWSATSTEKGYISPNLVNGNNPWLVINSTGTSTFANGVSISNGCFAVNGVCVGSGSGTVTAVTGTYPVISSGGATPAISLAFGTTTSNTWGGTQTFTNPPQLGSLSGLIAGNLGILYAQATTSASCSGTVSCSAFTILGSSPITLIGSASGTGLSTTTPWVTGNLAYVVSNGTVSSVATSTLTASSPLTGSFTQIGTGGALGCQTASGSQAGCLLSADWTTFNGKQAAITGTQGQNVSIGAAGTPVATSTIFTTTGSLVGIGLTGPATQLEANGIIRADRPGVPTQYLQIDGGGPSGQEFQAVGANKQFFISSLDNQAAAGTNNGILFRTNTTAAPVVHMQLSNTGLFVGGPAVTASKSQLDVLGNVSVGSSYAGVTAAPTDGLIVQGNVGIGTTSPSSRLNVSGSDSGTTITNASVAMIDVTNSDTTANNFSDYALSGINSTGSSVVDSKIVGLHVSHTATSETGALLFLTRNAGTLAERARITQAGDLLVSTNGNFLQFRRNTGGAIINVLGITGGTDVVRLGAANSTTGSPSFQFVNTGAVPLETITGEGNFGIGTTTPGTLLSVGNATTGTGINFSLATSTFTNVGGINLTTGCYAMNGVCISGGSSGITALTGDVTATGPGSVTATLATVNSNVGSFGSATQTGTFTVNGKGLVTAAANVTITPNFASVLGGTAGSVMFSNGTNLAQDNANFFWDDANNRLGIGTSTPGSMLSIGGAGTGWNFYDNATSTKNGVGGINLSQGCFAINNVCLTSGTGTVTSVTLATPNSSLTLGGTNPVTTSGTINADLNLANPNTWTVLQRFSQASTTQLSVFNQAFFGATATSTFSSTGALTLASALAATSGGTGTATYTTGDTLYASGSNTLSKLSIGTTGQVLTIAGGVPTWATISANHLLSATSTVPGAIFIGPNASSTIYSTSIPGGSVGTANVVKITLYMQANVPTSNIVNLDFAYGNATSTYNISLDGTNISANGTATFLIIGQGSTSSQNITLAVNLNSSGTTAKGYGFTQTTAATVNSAIAQQITIVAKSNNTNGDVAVYAATAEILK